MTVTAAEEAVWPGSYHAARELARIAPNSERVYLLGVAALHVNRPWEAIEHLTSIDPDRGWLEDQARYWRTLGRAYHRIGEYEEELRTFEELRGRRPELAPFGRFWPLVGLGRIPEVLELLQHLVTSRGGSAAMDLVRRAFADGLDHTFGHHFRPDLSPLRSYPPFRERFRPQR